MGGGGGTAAPSAAAGLVYGGVENDELGGGLHMHARCLIELAGEKILKKIGGEEQRFLYLY